MSEKSTPHSNRRTFLMKGGALAAGAAAAGSLNIARAAHAYGSDAIKVALIGCGGRGTGAANQAMNTSGGDVRVVAMADAFQHRLEGSEKDLRKRHPEKIDVNEATRFVGPDSYKKAVETDCDMVILASPPGFRPLHFEAAINAGKHVFAEKPVACDAPGVRRFLAATEKAKEKGLAVQVGLQRHHEKGYQATIAQLHDGAIGEFILARAYWNNPGVWVRQREASDTELSYQCNNWYYFNWLSGDHINEQHIHNLDVINWVMKDYPTEAQRAKSMARFLIIT
jgi:myo-inositol 2-dehydrogenase / D-chiro-inositol 1-dehydrogenase